MGRFKESILNGHPSYPQKPINNLAPAKSTKAERILRILAEGVSLNTFEGHRLGDTCLNSTVSALQHRYGIRIDRKTENVPNSFGGKTQVMRYFIAPDQRERALAVLGQMRRGDK